MKKAIHFLVATLGTILFALFLAVMLVEWAAGCGETYIDSKGVRHAHECVFIK